MGTTRLPVETAIWVIIRPLVKIGETWPVGKNLATEGAKGAEGNEAQTLCLYTNKEWENESKWGGGE